MKNLIISLILSILLASCSSDIETFEYDPKYLIEIDFKSGQIKEGGKVLKPASSEISAICVKAINNEPLPEDYNAKILCIGSGGNNVEYFYVFISSSTVTGYFLVSRKEDKYLTHIVNAFEQNSCLKRWIMSS
ncbi:hypothetical protein C1637_09795 [Chryseobacterium lactis]|uniref:Lipoprotein n=1 Tax=Chryseobacterium lactis TaxID=1241981 RepID=A0A3G6RER2_CHRLC|nr:hypothetical protein [Chryseobacterium lactis]AZA82197.1 hypothetical protein EG342_09905 [Chryseobacterium lactis]AZB02578.1 hypothetical protein EG341_00760 [Chryseobacterium lactis]PNW14127.1 hypothetical protein C1637_09795 [Chryseobacterium lactis]